VVDFLGSEQKMATGSNPTPMHPQVQQQRSGSPTGQLAVKFKAIRPCFHRPAHRLQFIFRVVSFGKESQKSYAD